MAYKKPSRFECTLSRVCLCCLIKKGDVSVGLKREAFARRSDPKTKSGSSKFKFPNRRRKVVARDLTYWSRERNVQVKSINDYVVKESSVSKYLFRSFCV